MGITTVATLTLLPPMLISPVVVLLMVLVMSITTHSLSDRIPGIPPFGTSTNNTMVLSVIQTHSIHTILSAIMLVEPNPTPDDNLSEPISQPKNQKLKLYNKIDNFGARAHAMTHRAGTPPE